MSALERLRSLQARTLLRPYALVFLYRRRLRVHIVQELLAGVGVAIAVALVFAAMVANASVAGSAREVIDAVVGPANLQLHARGSDGLDERLLARVEHLAGVEQAVPLLEQSATIVGPTGRRASVDLAGATASLGQLDGLPRTLPIAAFSPGGIGLTRATAEQLGITSSNATGVEVSLELRGTVHQLKVAAVLGREAAGALSQARVAVMPLASMQQLAGLQGRLTRILVQTRRGHEAAVRAALSGLAGGRLTVAGTDAEVALLRQALRPSDQASGFFAAISALLGFLFAFNAMLLTVPERRQAIADLRLIGTKRAAIVQIVAFQALCLGIAASLVGLLAGYALSLGAFHQSSGYLAEAFTIGTNTVVGIRPLLLALGGGILATSLASAVPLLDLRRGQALDAVYFEDGAPGNALGRHSQLRLALAVLSLLALATVLFRAQASLGFIASGVLALATVLAVPLAFAGALKAGAALAAHHRRLTILQVALTSLKAATLRSLALAATGAVAIFGGIALGGSRDDLLRGIDGFAHSYAADADLLVGNPGDNQATVPFDADHYARRIAAVPGVASVDAFQGGFLELGDRRTWVIARPPGANRMVLSSQIVDGNASTAVRRLGEGGWIAVSQQIAEQHHAALGDPLTLPTPSGDGALRARRYDDQPRVEPWRDPHGQLRLQPLLGHDGADGARRESRAGNERKPGALHDRARAGPTERTRSLDGTHARIADRRVDERRSAPARRDIDAARRRCDPRHGGGAGIERVAASRVPGRAAARGRATRSPAARAADGSDADAQRGLRDGRGRRDLRRGHHRRLSQARHGLPGGERGREPAPVRDHRAGDRRRSDPRGDPGLGGIARLPHARPR